MNETLDERLGAVAGRAMRGEAGAMGEDVLGLIVAVRALLAETVRLAEAHKKSELERARLVGRVARLESERVTAAQTITVFRSSLNAQQSH